ncbi:MAG TPA: hypothetical protein PLA12_05265 [Candidatus Hydrogenedens sp.]|nr:hypothetical protein [Candidatus Hydrogenedens sp.]
MSKQKDKNSTMKRIIADLLLFLLIAVLSSVIVYEHLTIRVKTIGRDYRFEQDWLVNAISIACGQGFTTPVAPYPENMRLFLEQKTSSMQFSDLPKDWGRWDNSRFVRTHYYLIYTIGILWRWFGINWDVLKLYAGIVFVITVLATYIPLYMFSGRITAFITTCLVMNAPSLLFLLPSIRDYSKTTFFMLFLAISTILFYFANKCVWRTAIFSSLLGFAIGIGLGFRQDVLILFFLGLSFIAIIGGKFFYQKKIIASINCFVLYLLSFLATGYPILLAIAEDKGAVSSHSLVQGLASTVEQTSMGGTASYRLVYEPNDMLVHSTIASFARRTGFKESFDNYLSPAYGSAGRAYFRSVVWHLPADLWGRVLSSCSNCFSTIYNFTKEQKQNHQEFNRPSHFLFFTDCLYYWDIFLAYIGPWALLGIVFITGMKNIWKGILIAGVLVYLLGYPSILFEYRHVVHLTPILYGIIIVFIYELSAGFIHTLYYLYRKKLSAKTIFVGLRNGVIVLLFVLCSCTLLYSLLILWQKYQLLNLVSSYRQLNWEEVSLNHVDNGANILFQPSKTLPAFEKVSELPPMETPFEFLRADFELTEIFPIYSLYDNTYYAVDFSEPLNPLLHFYAPKENKPLRISIYFLVYSASTIKPRNEPIFNNREPIIWVRGTWKGVEIPKEFKTSFRGLYRAKNPSAEPFLITLVAPENNSIKGYYKHWKYAWDFRNVRDNIERYKIYDQYK